jgi:hypothetical protein
MARSTDPADGDPTPKAPPDGTAAAGRPLTDAEVKAKVMKLDPLERKVGYAGAALAAVIAFYAALPGVMNPKHTYVNDLVNAGKNHSCPHGFKYTNVAHVGWRCQGSITYPASHWVQELLLLLVFALALLVTARIGRRSLLGFSALLAGLAFYSEVGILGLPFVVAGGWLLVRAWRTQRYGSPTATARSAAAAGGSAGAAAGTAGATSGRSTSAKSSGRAKKDKTPTTATGRPVPTASKRYTPKTPPRKRPTPS